MLKDIKSSANLKAILSCMCEKMWMNLIKYNKTLQKENHIDLYNYQIFSGKYMTKELYGKRKIYNAYTNELIFEGQYLNGKRNGPGKEYSKGNLIFEGEYLNGEKNGKGIEYNEKGKILFEGEYLNGKKNNGKIKEFFKNGNLKFESEYVNGKRNGKSKDYNIDRNLVFDGEYLDGKKWNGKGYDNHNNIIYELIERI